jgi:hypothetical protein
MSEQDIIKTKYCFFRTLKQITFWGAVFIVSVITPNFASTEGNYTGANPTLAQIDANWRTLYGSPVHDAFVVFNKMAGGTTNDVSKVPKLALTVDVQTVTDAKQVVIIANEYKKARALQKIIEEGVNHMWTASVLQLHPKALIASGEEAVVELKVATYKYFKDIEKDNLDPATI